MYRDVTSIAANKTSPVYGLFNVSHELSRVCNIALFFGGYRFQEEVQELRDDFRRARGWKVLQMVSFRKVGIDDTDSNEAI